MKSYFSGINIHSISTALPKNQLDLRDFEKQYGEKEVNRIISSTGIQSVPVADLNQPISDFFQAAVENLIQQCDLEKSSIDGLVVVTQTPDHPLPATSTILQHKLGLSKDTIAFDINYGCSGYIYGLYQAAMLLSSGGCKRVIVCAGDLLTRCLNPKEQNVRMLFGDAVSATLVEKGDKDKELHFLIKTDGSGANYLKRENSASDSYLYMNGAKVMEFALREVPPIIEELLLLQNWKKEEVGTFALHQANQFMVRYLQKKLHLSEEAVPVAVEKTGNTGPASIPLMLSLQHKALKANAQLEKTILCGFGVGLSWGAVSCNLTETSIFDPIYL